jgi:TonB-linked SusC/RagA family outer membrane protein
MKLTAILLFIVCVTFGNSFSQVRLTVRFENADIRNVIQTIEEKTEYVFLYKDQIFDFSQKVSADFSDAKFEDVLKKFCDQVGVSYEVRDRQIILKEKEFKPLNEAQQQKKEITGTAKDKNGIPLPGVTFMVKGTTIGTVTDSDGNFMLSIPVDAKILVCSFVGMKTQEIPLVGKTAIHVIMEDETIGLEEVIAVGYGTMKKSDLTGVVTRIDNTKNESLSNTNVIQALRGSIPGISISAGGNAGAGSEISVRGENSISGGNSALIVVDGIIYNGQIGNLNPNDIASIDVLRDASSAAIFGSKAANGVILITTKKGSTDKPTVQVNSYVGLQDILMTQDFETPEEYVQKRINYQKTLAFRGVAPQPDISNPVMYLNDAEVENYKNGITVDAFDKISRVAPIQNYNMSVSASNNNTNYFISGSWTDQKGVVIGDQFKRASIRINLETSITDWLKIGTNSSFSFVDTSDSPASLYHAFQLSPYSTWYLDEAQTILNPLPMTDGLVSNPLLPTLNKLDRNRKDLFCIAYSEVKLPFVKGLTYRFTYSNNLGSAKNYSFIPSFNAGGLNRVASSSSLLSETQEMNLENLLKYNTTIKEDHTIDATLLYSYNYAEYNELLANANTFPTDILDFYSLSLGANQTTDASYNDYHAIAMMARLNYRYKGKYLFTATGRRDGASVFSTNHKFAFFPSLALGWIISEESFMKNIDWINFMKLRASYGANGNQAIAKYQSLSTIQPGYNYLLGGNTAFGIAKTAMGNPDLKWESTYATNYGVDFELLKNRVSGNINYYDSDTKDLLLARNIPTLNGFSSILSNLGQVNNKGVEITVNTVNVKNKDFEWSTGFNFTTNKNTIEKLYGETDENGKELDDISNGWFIGKSLGAYYNYETNGIWQIGDAIPTGFRAGDFKIVDQNNDGIISPDKDRKIIGYNRPDWTFGFNTTLNYKGFTFYMLVNGSVGGVRDNAGMYDPSSVFNYRVRDQYIKWWTPEEQSTSVPSMDYQDSYSLNWLESTTFVRLQDVSLSYDFGKPVLERLKFGSLQLYISSKNPFLWSKWGGWDPETTGSGRGQYPTMKSVIAGVKFTL